MRYRRVPNLGEDYMQTIERVNILERIVQAIGFTPDFPYTLNVNDGTRNRVLIGKIDGDYGIKIVNSAGVEIVFADGHISASGITTGTLDASVVNVVNLNADNIVAGTISASKISGGTLNCSLITVSNLSASSINTGSMSGSYITTNSLDANRIKANSITASQLSTGELITSSAQIKSGTITNAHISSLDAGKITAGTLDCSEITVSNLSASVLNGGTINANNINVTNITATNINRGTLSVGGTGKVGQLIITQSSQGDAYLRFGSSKGSRIWVDSNGVMGFNALGGDMYFYVDSYQKLFISSDAQAYIGRDVDGERTGLKIWGNFNTAGGAVRMQGNYTIIENNVETNHLDPRSSESYNLGGTDAYWYTTHTKYLDKLEGGFTLYDDGVELQDGRIVSDTEALLSIKAHKSKVSERSGKPEFDKTTLPKDVRRIPTISNRGNPIIKKRGKYIERGKVLKDIDGKEEMVEEDIEHYESEDVFAMMSIMIGAIRELTERVKSLEEK